MVRSEATIRKRLGWMDSSSLVPVIVERIGVGAWSWRKRIKVMDWHVTTHLVIHSHRSKGMGEPLEESRRAVPGQARRVNLAVAGAAVEKRIDALGASRLPSKSVETLVLDSVRVFHEAAVGVARTVKIVTARIRGESAWHIGESHQQAAPLFQVSNPRRRILGTCRRGRKEEEESGQSPANPDRTG